MLLNKKKTLSNLKKKGFTDSVNRSGDHLYLDFFHEGKLILHTKVSHGSNKDIDDYLIKQMSVQCKLTKLQFKEFAECTLSAEQYVEILIESEDIEK